MPILRNAAKALRQDRRRTVVNKKVKNKMKKAVKEVVTTQDAANLPSAFSAVDRAAKKNLIHKKKAARMKSQLAKMVAVAAPAKESAPAKKTTKKAPKKTAK